MDTFIDNWLPGLVFLIGAYVVPYLPRVFRTSVQRVRSLRGRGRATEWQRWNLPERLRTLADRMSYVLLGYGLALVVVIVALATMPEDSRHNIGKALLTEGGVFSDDASLVFLIVMCPLLGMFVLPLVVMYGDMIVSIRQLWRESNTTRKKLTFIVAYGCLALLAIGVILSILFDYIEVEPIIWTGPRPS